MHLKGLMKRIPTSTYRLQMNASFTFEDAARVADYLRALGVSHVYCSPILQAAPGSMHGYDVIDHQTVNEEIGGEVGHRRFCQRLKEIGLGQVLDIVPNHMAAIPQNKYWWDVLENGPWSLYASWFDIDWNSAEVKLKNKVLIPVLGDQYGRILTAGQIKVEHEGDLFQVRYMDNVFPLAPRSVAVILSRGAEQTHCDMLSFIAESLSRLPSPDANDRDAIAARQRDKTIIYGLLRRLCEEQPEACSGIADIVEELNTDNDQLDELLNLQHYRLAFWRTADQELGYRRFFDVNSLIGLRVERPHVFEATHARILEWVRSGTLDGVRVDHPDGLRDPQQYFDSLRNQAQDAWIIGEKILEPGESLRENWPIEGTSGYEFLGACNDLLTQRDGLKELTEIYRDFTHEPVDFDAVAHDKKVTAMQEALGSDVNRLASLFVDICETSRDRRDYTRAEIRRALREVAACFEIYRTYVVAERDEVTEEDRLRIDRAVAKANERRPDLDTGLMDFIGDVLTLRTRGGLQSEFLLRFQQFTSPVMAKGVEDTAFYCFNRMVGLNEVGGAPGCNGLTVTEFHEFCARLQAAHPATMTTLSTHDTKRSDDVRARLAAITEIPGRWRSALSKWSRMNGRFKQNKYPDCNTEYFLYQTLIGAWPISKERLIAYMEKATREAKQQTSWTQQNPEFENALRSFIEHILESTEFIGDLESFVGRVLEAGRINSIAQTLLKCTTVGVPDTYQGGELWDLRLVDPDNRGAVDYEIRRRLLRDLQGGMEPEQIMQGMDCGLPKLWAMHRALHLRREHPEWFGAEAGYTPLGVDGSKSEHVVAFVRGDSVVTVVPRWTLKLGGNWAGTAVELPDGRWKNLLTRDVVAGGKQRVQGLLKRFPVALLVRETE